jgi:hypothetical protein
MALALNPHQRAVFEAQQRIFNLLCAAFRRSDHNAEFRLKIDDVKRQLDLPENIFTEALKKFAGSIGEHTVILFEQNGVRYVTLGESAKFNVSDWVYVPRPEDSSRSTTPARSTRGNQRHAEAPMKNK